MTDLPATPAAIERHMPLDVARRCPLCSGDEHGDGGQLPYAEILDQPDSDWEARFERRVRVRLMRCHRNQRVAAENGRGGGTSGTSARAPQGPEEP